MKRASDSIRLNTLTVTKILTEENESFEFSLSPLTKCISKLNNIYKDKCHALTASSCVCKNI